MALVPPRWVCATQRDGFGPCVAFRNIRLECGLATMAFCPSYRNCTTGNPHALVGRVRDLDVAKGNGVDHSYRMVK